MLFDFILFMSVGTIYACGEVFSSVDRMKQLPKIEQKLIAACDRFLEHKHKIHGFAKFKRFLDSTRKENEKALRDETYVENPINGFRLLWRLSERWLAATTTSRTEKVIGDDDTVSDFFVKIRSSIKKVSLWPTADDITGAANGLVRLSLVFNLDINQLIGGSIGHYHTEPLTGDEVFAITKVVYQTEEKLELMAWLNKSVDLMTSENTEAKHADEAIELKTKLLASMKNRKRDDSVDKNINKCNGSGCHGDSLSEKLTSNGQNSEVHTTCHSMYEQLCRENTRTAADNSKLHCQYQTTSIPFIKAKAEYVHTDPPIMLFHDVISDIESYWIINTSRHMLSRSLMGKFNTSGEYFGKKRISQSAWIYDDLDVSAKLSKRIGLLTGLSTRLLEEETHAEPFQIHNYGLGGMYEPHEDSVRLYRQTGKEENKAVRNSGDRIATWLFYLTDVKVGGATVFPLLNTRVPVTKGSAAFWYNLKQNGDPDMRTIHAGCPVLIGDKWVANKWIREVGQMFRRKCALDRDL
ncbi:prolyl 4-hydroxylase subunit alpha-1-like [Gigantopelta aegis]|uniref:prolyl 4-hydroxylase subunit alpha-1-like n=1 Tax=Gigantopelta aegis TaxID=1735272 RepID=UPI001B88DB58|nr:prolyl 4-hydroxylase subunit alpha-1-like [Gigantopelta aegis]